MIFKVSKFKGTFGIEKLGKPPLTLAKSPTLGISILRARTNTVVKSIATKVDGTTFVIMALKSSCALTKTLMSFWKKHVLRRF